MNSNTTLRRNVQDALQTLSLTSSDLSLSSSCRQVSSLHIAQRSSPLLQRTASSWTPPADRSEQPNDDGTPYSQGTVKRGEEAHRRLREAYRAAALRTHPDKQKNQNSSSEVVVDCSGRDSIGSEADSFLAVRSAYETLKNAIDRAHATTTTSSTSSSSRLRNGAVELTPMAKARMEELEQRWSEEASRVRQCRGGVAPAAAAATKPGEDAWFRRQTSAYSSSQKSSHHHTTSSTKTSSRMTSASTQRGCVTPQRSSTPLSSVMKSPPSPSLRTSWTSTPTRAYAQQQQEEALHHSSPSVVRRSGAAATPTSANRQAPSLAFGGAAKTATTTTTTTAARARSPLRRYATATIPSLPSHAAIRKGAQDDSSFFTDDATSFSSSLLYFRSANGNNGGAHPQQSSAVVGSSSDVVAAHQFHRRWRNALSTLEAKQRRTLESSMVCLWNEWELQLTESLVRCKWERLAQETLRCIAEGVL